MSLSTAPQRVERNPDWVRDELILALDLYLRFRDAPPSQTSAEVTELSELLKRLATLEGRQGGPGFRNANGVYMKMMNFRRFDPQHSGGLPRGAESEAEVWTEFAEAPVLLKAAAQAIRARVEDEAPPESRYWVFVCNPKKWAIDEFLRTSPDRDTWGVRPADRLNFAPGQLALVRVGVDRRNTAERKGRDVLQPGVYAFCEVESLAFEATGAAKEFWAPGEGRSAGWPTVQIRYLNTYLDRPLLIETLREQLPEISPLMLNGHQAASFPIPAADFRAIAQLLGQDLDTLSAPPTRDPVDGKMMAALEAKYLNASPEVKERVSRSIERGPIGELAKRITNRKCQLCEALGKNPTGFLRRDGRPYVEAHHVMPVSKRRVGSLSLSNIMTLCANHHRQVHYGEFGVTIADNSFEVVLDGVRLSIARLSLL
jgi:predicted HNH restriction endonuclease